MSQQKYNVSEIEQLLELRMFTYDLLRQMFLAEPTKELMKQLQNGIIEHLPFQEEHSELKEGVDQVNNYLSTFDLEENFEELHWDYTRMFIGPYKLPVPIWESAYTNKDGLLFQEETLRVRRLYLKNDLLSMQDGYEADDHLGLELDYMYHLSKLLIELAKEDKLNHFNKILNDQAYFLHNHLLNWVPRFSKQVIAHAETEFYKGMVKILNGFLAIDKMCMKELLNRTKQSTNNQCMEGCKCRTL